MAQMAENMLLNEDNKSMIVQCATFSKSLNPRNINKSVSDIRIRFPFQSRSGYPYPVANSPSCRIPNQQTG